MIHKIPFEWEELYQIDWSNGYTGSARVKVINGWLIRNYTCHSDNICESTVFIPDPNHEWNIDNES